MKGGRESAKNKQAERLKPKHGRRMEGDVGTGSEQAKRLKPKRRRTEGEIGTVREQAKRLKHKRQSGRKKLKSKTEKNSKKKNRKEEVFLGDLRGLKQEIRCAAAALSYYNNNQNKQKDTRFELVEVLSHHSEFTFGDKNCGTSDYCLWHHLNFMARLISFSTSSLFVPCTIKIFFAEVRHIPDGFFISSCSIIDPNDPTAGNTIGCGFCPPAESKVKPIYHPADGFFAGHYPHSPPI